MTALIIHGGAGTFPEVRQQPALSACREAFARAWTLLAEGGSAVDAVEAAVCVMEDAPVLDAGHGSYPDTAGRARMDAIIVDGATLGFGAVACIGHVGHPISVARRVWEATDHCMLVGDDATAFAHDQGFGYVSDEELLRGSEEPAGQGTVGAVALDAAGHIAAATSTGGMRGRMPGRVGDSPLIGCGAIAEDGVGAVSATGHGEPMMKVMISRTALDQMRAGLSAEEAASCAIAHLKAKTRGEGGIICVDASGRIGYAHNTKHMPRIGQAADGSTADGL